MTKSVALIESKRIQPPPTKKEICEALYRMERDEHIKADAKAGAENSASYQKVLDVGRATIMENFGDLEIKVELNYNGKISFSGQLPDHPKILKLIAAHQNGVASRKRPSFNHEAVKARIHDQIFGDRVQAMLKDPETVKALETLKNRVGSIAV